MADPSTPRLVLDAAERRVLGTLIEKGLTTPQQYPLTLNALVVGCNQRNNREPISHYTEEEVEEVCGRLQAKGLVAVVQAATGRVHRWRQELGRVHELRRADLAVAGELLLRGAQTEGELRTRASRMENVESLEALHEILARLEAHAPPLVLRLSPPGFSRGVRWTHACQSEEEARALVENEARGGGDFQPSGAAAGGMGGGSSASLLARLEALEARVAALEAAAGQEPEVAP